MIETSQSTIGNISNTYHKSKSIIQTNNTEIISYEKRTHTKTNQNVCSIINNYFDQDNSSIPIQSMMMPRSSFSDKKIRNYYKKRKQTIKFKNPFVEVVQIESFKKDNYSQSYESFSSDDGRKDKRCCFNKCTIF